MRILIDTNIILDVLGHRKEFYEDSFSVLQEVHENHAPCVYQRQQLETSFTCKRNFLKTMKSKKSGF